MPNISNTKKRWWKKMIQMKTHLQRRLKNPQVNKISNFNSIKYINYLEVGVGNMHTQQLGVVLYANLQHVVLSYLRTQMVLLVVPVVHIDSFVLAPLELQLHMYPNVIIPSWVHHSSACLNLEDRWLVDQMVALEAGLVIFRAILVLVHFLVGFDVVTLRIISSFH